MAKNPPLNAENDLVYISVSGDIIDFLCCFLHNFSLFFFPVCEYHIRRLSALRAGSHPRVIQHCVNLISSTFLRFTSKQCELFIA